MSPRSARARAAVSLLLSAGHHPGGRGACFGDFCEHDEAVRWVAEIVKRIDYRVSTLLVPALDLVGKVKWINKQTTARLAVEIHFNSDAQRKGRGSETLYCPGSVKGYAAAEVMQDAIASVLKPNRGVKEGWHRQDRPGHKDYAGDIEGDERVDYFLKATRCTALIIEPEFIHRKDIIESERVAACARIADALVFLVGT